MIISSLSGREQMSGLCQQIGAPTFEAGVCHPLLVQMLLCLLGVRSEVAKTMHTVSAPCWADEGIRSVRSIQVGEHGTFPLLYTEIFPGCAVCCTADLAFTQIKRVYVLHAQS